MVTVTVDDEECPATTRRMIRFRSMIDEKGDSDVFEVSERAVQISEFLKDAAEVQSHEGDGKDDDVEDMNEKAILEIDVPRVGGNCLGKVVEFLKHFDEEAMNEVPKFLNGSTFNDVVTQEWYQSFISDQNIGIISETKMLFELVQAGNFLGIEKLLDLVVLKLTFMLLGKSEEEIRTVLGLPEMTDAEKKQASEDFPWIFNEI